MTLLAHGPYVIPTMLPTSAAEFWLVNVNVNFFAVGFSAAAAAAADIFLPQIKFIITGA